MNFLFFLLLILGFVIYYELRILKVTKKCDKENYDGKTDLYKKLQLKSVLDKEAKENNSTPVDDQPVKEDFSNNSMINNCPLDFQEAKCKYDNVLKRNLCMKEIGGNVFNVDKSCCNKDCLNIPVEFDLNKKVFCHQDKSAAVADLGGCSGNYNTPTKNGELEYAGYYFCYDDTKNQCVQKPRHVDAWRNTCGNSVMTSGPLPVFDNKNECLKYRADTRCYNNDGTEKTEQECLQTSYCGWCNEGNAGKGKCVPGTPIGPNDITLKCFPNIVSGNFSYRYGNTNPFILDHKLRMA